MHYFKNAAVSSPAAAAAEIHTDDDVRLIKNTESNFPKGKAEKRRYCGRAHLEDL